MIENTGGPLVYVPLGGAGEIGMNCYLYGLGEQAARRWIMVELGIGFGTFETAPGVELILPDLTFVLEEKERLEGIFITHAHEDHLGALPYLWRRLRVPIHARPFAAEVIRRKFATAGIEADAVRQVRSGERIEAAGFSVEWLDVTHSIPEGSMLAIRSPAGTVLHTGDFKFDPDPQVGPGFDPAALEKLAEEGVLAVLCDSTNVFLPGRAGSEAEIVDNLRKIIEEAPLAVAATCFASNIARLRTLATAAQQAGRSVVVVGRAMREMIDVARATGIIADFPDLVDEEQAAEIPAEHLFYLVTGSQGEGRAALARIAAGTHQSVKLEEGDTVIFSSKTIPGNEGAVHRLYNRLSEQGVRVIDGDMARIHVSGHARRDDMRWLYETVKPKVAVPIHGEHRHLAEHVRAARAWGVPEAVLAPNGTVVRLDGRRAEVIEHVETGRVFMDGNVEVGALEGVVRERIKLAWNGHVAVSIVVDEDGALLADPEIVSTGVPRDGEGWEAPLDEMIAEAVDQAVETAPAAARRSDADLEQIVRRATRRVTTRLWGKRPVTSVLVTRLED